MEEMRNKLTHGLIDVDNYTIQLMNEFLRGDKPSLDYQRINPFEMSEYLKTDVMVSARASIKRYEQDIFKFRNYVESLNSLQNIDVLRNEAKNLRIETLLEDLFLFNEKEEVCIWDIYIRVYNDEEIYDAAELGFL